jgi:hypothetical protein
MKVGDFRYTVQWDVRAPETWRIDGMTEKVAAGFSRVRRFRTQFALQLQQEFIGNLGRVGTLAAVPARYLIGVRIFLRTRDGTARLLLEKAPGSGDAVYLVGRTSKGDARESLLTSESLRDEFRRALLEVPQDSLPAGGPTAMVTLRDDPAFYRRFEPGLKSKKGNKTGVKPFEGTPYNVVQIVTERVCTVGEAVPANYNSIIIEVDLD